MQFSLSHILHIYPGNILILFSHVTWDWGTRWRSWLRHALQVATSRVQFPMESMRFFIHLALVDSASNTKPGISPGVKGGRCLSRPVYLLLHMAWAYSLVSPDLQDLHPKMLFVLISLVVLHTCTASSPLISFSRYFVDTKTYESSSLCSFLQPHARAFISSTNIFWHTLFAYISCLVT